MKKPKRSIPLDDEQYKMFRQTFKGPSVAAKLLGEMLIKLADDITEDHDKSWAIAKRLVDCQDDETISLNWIDRCIDVFQREVTDE